LTIDNKRLTEKPTIKILKNQVPIVMRKIQIRLWCSWKTDTSEKPTSVQNHVAVPNEGMLVITVMINRNKECWNARPDGLNYSSWVKWKASFSPEKQKRMRLMRH